MPNPFDSLKPNQPKKAEPEYDEWEGQFSCSTYGCAGYAKVARYYPKEKVLKWECQEGHESGVENIE